MSAAKERLRDIWGNTIGWESTGRRRITNGIMRAEMTSSNGVSWMGCRPHCSCACCAQRVDHVDCPVLRRPASTTEVT